MENTENKGNGARKRYTKEFKLEAVSGMGISPPFSQASTTSTGWLWTSYFPLVETAMSGYLYTSHKSHCAMFDYIGIIIVFNTQLLGTVPIP